MGDKQETRQSFNTIVAGDNIRYWTMPALGAGIAMISDGKAAAWAWSAYQVLVGAAPANPIWLCGIHFHTAAIATHYGDLAVASGPGGNEVDLAIFPYRLILVGATANLLAMPTIIPSYLPYPIRILGAPAISGRIRKDTAANADGGTLKIVWVTGIGI